MDIGLVGLGKMGGNMRTRLRNAGHTVVGYDRNPDVSDVGSLEEMVEQLPSPKVVWVMVPAGDPTRETVKALGEPARRGRPRRRRRQLQVDRRPGRTPSCSAEKGIGFVDCGVSGGVWGLENGYALMCGGSDEDVAKVQPAFDALKPEGDARLRARRPAARRRPLRQDGPQRHRVRHHAGLRRGLGAAREGRPGRQRHRGLRLLARGHRHPLLAARPAGRRARGGHPPRQDRRLRRGLRRGPLDRRGRDRQRRADARHRRLAVRAVRLPPGRQPGDEGDRRDAQPVRRPRRPAPSRPPAATRDPTDPA